MAIRREAVALEVLRGAVAQKVETTSLRFIAEAVGMSTTGLYMFIQQGTPQNRNYRKLLAWYVQERRVAGQEIDMAAVQASLEMLTLHLPARQRRDVQRKILELIGDVIPPPQPPKMKKKSR
jgi:hypothetical protein